MNTASLDEIVVMNAVKNDMLAMVVHDLRNPLTCIEGYIMALQSMPLPDSERTELLGRVLSCARWAGSLVSDLNDTAAIENGKLSLNRRVISLGGVIEEAVVDFEKSVRARGSKVAVGQQLSRNPMFVFADPIRMRQVAHNLLTNAARCASNEGDIQVAAYHFGDYAVVEVADDGCGISPGDQMLVFNKFFRKGPSDKGSLGLGLYIARAIVEAHSGFIGVRSEGPGKGSTFHFSLPIFNAERTYTDFKKGQGADTPPPRLAPVPPQPPVRTFPPAPPA